MPASPFSEDLLAIIASSLLLKSKSFPKDLPKWDGKIPEDQNLQAWEDYFHPLHKELELESILARGRSAFGSAHSAALIHNISPPPTHSGNTREPHCGHPGLLRGAV